MLALSDSFEYLYVMSLRPLEICQFFQREYRLHMSDSDVYRCQNLTYKDGPRAERAEGGKPTNRMEMSLKKERYPYAHETRAK